MKPIVMYIIGFFILSCDMDEAKSDLVGPSYPICSSISISIDGDETVYEFDSKGGLLFLLGESTNDLYVKGAWTKAIGEVILEYKPGFFIKRKQIDANGSGWKTTRTMLKDKIIFDDVWGYEENKEIIHTRIDYDYADGGINASQKEWYSEIDGSKVLDGSSKISYSNHKSPFEGNVFQAFIEEGWTAAAGTNNFLANEEQYIISSNTDEYVSTIKGTISYKYIFDGKNRISSVSIQDVSLQEVKYNDGRTASIPNEKIKSVKFEYTCK